MVLLSLRMVVVSLVGATLLASAAACPEEKVTITVLTVLATDKNKEIDPRLKRLADNVRTAHPGLTGFRLQKTNRKKLEVGKETKFELVDQETVNVTVERGADKDNRCELTVKAAQLGQICYTCCCGKYLPIWTDYKNDMQESLIIAVMVEPCKK